MRYVTVVQALVLLIIVLFFTIAAKLSRQTLSYPEIVFFEKYCWEMVVQFLGYMFHANSL